MRWAGAGMVAGALAISACGAGGAGDGLAWVGVPRLLKPAGLSRDRVLYGTVVNRSSGAVLLDARRVHLLDGAGRVTPAVVRFLAAFAHGLFSPQQFTVAANPRERASPLELRRLGVLVRLAPGQTMPVNVAWRVGPAGAPTRLDYGRGALSIASK